MGQNVAAASLRVARCCGRIATLESDRTGCRGESAVAMPTVAAFRRVSTPGRREPLHVTAHDARSLAPPLPMGGSSSSGGIGVHDAKGERWAGRVIGWICLASLAPFAYYVGTHRRGTILERLESLDASWLAPDVADSTGAASAQASGLGHVVIIVGGVLFVVTMWLRRRASRRLVRHSVEAGSAPQGSGAALPLTVAAWTVLFAAGGTGGVFVVAGDRPNTSDIAQNFIDHPAWMLLAAPGLALAVASSHFFHRRRFELQPLGAAGLVPALVTRQQDEAPSFREGLRAFGRTIVIEVGFGLVLLVESIAGDEPTDYEQFFAVRLFGITLAPAIFAGVFLLLFGIMRPTRPMVRRALSQPLTIASLALLAAGFALDALGSPIVVSSAVIVIGGLIGSITGLYVQDLGPQPWLGIIFLLFLYGLALHDGDSMVLPTTVLAWGLLALTTIYTVMELRRQWRGTYAGSGR